MLAKPADAISVLEVIEAIDGPLRLSECLADATACRYSSNCNLRRLLEHLQTEMTRTLRSAKVADLVNGFEKSAGLVRMSTYKESF